MKPKVILLKPSWINHWNFVVVEILHTSHLEITIRTYDTLRWIHTSITKKNNLYQLGFDPSH
jgi:hypothetical protein